jgi:hypothetical protein
MQQLLLPIDAGSGVDVVMRCFFAAAVVLAGRRFM